MTGRASSLDVHVNAVGPWPAPEALLAKGCRVAMELAGVEAGEVSITLLDDEGISGLNEEYFKKAWPTDVIAFALHAPGEPVLGDVYLGYQQAVRQSEELDIPLEEELLRLAIHGALHVLGHEHPEGSERQESEMFRIQEEILSRVLRGSPTPEVHP